MIIPLRLLREREATAAVEMALVAPLLLVILFGSVELGNYFMNEHNLIQAVRDGARFAARQSFVNYTGCSGQPGGTVVADTTNVVMNAALSGGSLTTPNLTSNEISLTVSCVASTGGQNMLGIYRSRLGGTCNGSSASGCAQIVTVSATNVSYRSLLGSYGFSGAGARLNASSQAAVTGI